MNRTEHILSVIAEEGGEVAKEISKANRFGLDDQLTTDPHGERGTTGPTNREKIQAEFIDMLGAYQLAVKAGIMPSLGLDQLPPWVVEKMASKVARVEAYMVYAVRVGALQED